VTAAAQAEAKTRAADGRGPRLPDRRDLFELRRQFPPRANPASWPETRASRGGVLARVLAAPFTFEDANYQADVRRGICGVLDWLAAMPGQTWQQRWMASGSEQSADWRVLAAAPAAARRGCASAGRGVDRIPGLQAELLAPGDIRPSGRRPRSSDRDYEL
jgi:hypothetical protein